MDAAVMQTELAAALANLEKAAFESEDAVRAAAQAAATALILLDQPPLDPYAAPPALSALKKSLHQLRRLRAHGAVEVAAEVFEAVGLKPGWLMQLHAQSLIERGTLMPAIGLIVEGRAAAALSGDRDVENELLSLEGRAYKQLYIAASTRMPPARREVREDFLRKSAAAYGLAYVRMRGLGEESFPGGNLLALATLARRGQVLLSLPVPAEKVAHDILGRVKSAADAGKDISAWDHASCAEAHAYLGDWDAATESVRAYLRRLKAQADKEAGGENLGQINAFAINGTYRQFTEVWGVDPADTQRAEILTLLRYALIAAEGGSIRLDAAQTKQLLTAASGAESAAASHPVVKVTECYEKVLGTEGPMGLKRLKEIIDHSRLIARVVTDTARSRSDTVGTGFLLPGERLHAQFDGQVLLLTNAHVVSPNQAVRPASVPGEARICFDTCGFDDEISLHPSAMLWTSPPREHDATIFLLPKEHPHHAALREAASQLKIAPGLPPLMQRAREAGGSSKSTRVYIIGHPLGQELSFSLNDNELLDCENVYGIEPGPEPRKLHYMAPTEPGNSGSPVFNSRTLELIGLHHAGGERPRLNGKPGTYAANEGLWIRPLLTAFLMSRSLGAWVKRP